MWRCGAERNALPQQSGEQRIDGPKKNRRSRCPTPRSKLSLEPGAAGAVPTGLQPRQLVATVSVAQANRELVADQSAATVGEDGRATAFGP
jgi:hypothetical protein